MSQKFKKLRNTNSKSESYNKFYAKCVYERKHITTRELATFIQAQASVKRSDCLAVLDELGNAITHYLGLGHKVRIDNVGIFKCGLRNKKGGFVNSEDLTADTITPHVLFLPEYTKVKAGDKTRSATAMTADITFEEIPDYESPDPKPEPPTP